IAEPSRNADGAFIFDEKTNTDIARTLDIPVYFTVPTTARAPIPSKLEMPDRLIDFKHPEGRGFDGSVGLRVVVAQREGLSDRLGKSGLVQTGDLLLTFRSEWGGAGAYPNINLGISHTSVAYIRDGKVCNIDNPLNEEFLGLDGQLNSQHYKTLRLLH